MLRARKGRMIFMSSVVALLGSAGQANYAASKAGLVGLARSLARELASRNITVERRRARARSATDMTATLGEKRLAELDRRRAPRPLRRRRRRSRPPSPSSPRPRPATSPVPSSLSMAAWAWDTDTPDMAPAHPDKEIQ